MREWDAVIKIFSYYWALTGHVGDQASTTFSDSIRLEGLSVGDIFRGKKKVEPATDVTREVVNPLSPEHSVFRQDDEVGNCPYHF